ncbi:tetratricopeptide repeat protein [Nonomuraea sp. NPDC048901]|uniref:tetratricopeptide repeat protein n=1 Tax=Nonomuraea sp. NPDC048901 TaxID=3155627 RepID=UPI0033D45128
MTPTPSADSPASLPNGMDGVAREQGRLYQAARDQTINQVTHQAPRRPLPESGTVQVPAGLAGLPRRPAATFVGRDAALTAIRQALQDGTGPGVISQAVLGLGGVGKSELALQYAHRHRGQYRLVWWIDADGPDLIRAGLAAFARALACGIDSVAAEQATVEEAAAWALSWLAAHPDWLVIFDNIEEAADIEPYLAGLAHGHVLITTRRDIGWHYLGITPVPLELLPRSASVALLAGLVGPSDSANVSKLEELAEQLGDLPLALTQAGAYINRTPRTTVAKYLRLLKEAPGRMHAATPVGGDSERVVAKVLALSHDRIQSVNPLAIQVLNLLACMGPDNMPCSILNAIPGADEPAVDEALALLASYSLITSTTKPGDGILGSEEDLVSVHRLIQAVTLARLEPERRDSISAGAAALISAALPEDPRRPEAWPVCRALLPHARAVLAPTSPTLWAIALSLGHSGDYRTARDLFLEIHNRVNSSLGADHPDTLATRHEHALWMGEAGDPAAARDQLADLLPIRERILGADHPDTLDTRHNLARWTGRAGDAAAARDQFTDLLPIRERVLGIDHPDTLDTRHDVARWTGEAGDAAAARDQLANLIPQYVRVLGADHQETLITRHNLAYWTGEAGDAAAARDQLADLLPLIDRVLGADHPETLSTRHELASWTGEAGDAAAARDQLADLLPIRERILGTDHPYTLLTRHNLAYWTGEAGDAAAARDQLADLLPIRERILGTDHHYTLSTRHDAARWTGEAGDPAAARDQLDVLIPLYARVLGADHPDTLTTRHNLAYWTGEAGDAAAARDQYAALLPICERVLGADHPDPLAVRYNLADWTGEAGDPAAARDLLAALLPICERVLGADHPDTLITRDSLTYWTEEAGGQSRAVGDGFI